jgi:phosphatidylinositol N-acetylglucosaminyltransferase subunit H
MLKMLTVKRPTPTTVLYTVSTRAPIRTLTAHLANYLFILLRIVIGIIVATVLLIEYRSSSPIIDGTGPITWLENAILTSPSGQFASLLASSLTKIWRLLLCAAVTWLILRKGYTEESLLVIRGLGVQTSTSSPSYLWASGTRFIPTSSIQDIFIHEAFKGFQVQYYLMIVVENEDDVVVVFPVCEQGEE